MAGLDLSGQVGKTTSKGTTITQGIADAVAGDNAYIEIIQDNTATILREMPSAINRALEKIGILAEGHVVGYLTENYIVDTGRLRNSITHAIESGKAAVIGTNVEYAEAVHMGHRQEVGRYVPAIGKRLVQPFVQGKPFLTAPVQQHSSEYRDVLEEELKGN